MASPKRPDEAGHYVVEDSTCTFCGCVCDDIDVTVKDNHIVDAKRACVLGKAWFYNHHEDSRPSCLIEGRPASVDEGVELLKILRGRHDRPPLWVMRGTGRSCGRASALSDSRTMARARLALC